MKICPHCKTEFPPSVEFCSKDGATLPEDDGRGTGTKMLYDRLIGELVDGRYKIETRLGEGALATVYAATHELIEKRVALKVLKQEFVADAEIVERFLREAKAASRLNHKNIISLSDFGKVPSGAPFFVMELLDGRTLSDLLYDGKGIPVPEAIRLVTEIGQGLAAAHQHGVVHRDLKPDNIGLARDSEGVEHVKILDFGLAKIVQENRKLTRAGQVLGTPEYMSPEQASGQTVDQRSDIFALGILLYRLIVGRVPFGGKTFMEVISKVLSERPRSPRSLCNAPELTAPLEAVILRALSRAQEDRFPTMDAMLEALRRSTVDLADPTSADAAHQGAQTTSDGESAESVVSTWVDSGSSVEEPPSLEAQATGPTAVAPVVTPAVTTEGALEPTAAMDTVVESGTADAPADFGPTAPMDTIAESAVEPPSVDRVSKAAAEVEEGLGNLWIEEHTAERLIRRAAQRRARRRVMLIALVIGVVGVSAGALLAVVLTWDSQRRSKDVASRVQRSAPGTPMRREVPAAMELAPSSDPGMRRLTMERRPPPAPKTVLLDLRSVPPGATVYLHNKPLGRTPVSKDIALGSDLQTVAIVKPGYRPQYRRFRPNRDHAITILLIRVRAPTPGHVGTKRPRPMPRPGMTPRPRKANPLGDLKDPFATMKR